MPFHVATIRSGVEDYNWITRGWRIVHKKAPSLGHWISADCITFAETLQLAILATKFAPTHEFALGLANVCESAGAATDVAMLAGRVPKDERVRGNIPRHHKASTD